MEKLNEYIGVIADTVAKLVQEHGAQAVHLGMFVFQMEYIQGLMHGFLWLVLTVILFITGRILWNTGQKLKNDEVNIKRWREDRRNFRDWDQYLGFGLIAQLGSILPLLVALLYLVNIYNWVGATNPYAATALKVMTKVFEVKK